MNQTMESQLTKLSRTLQESAERLAAAPATLPGAEVQLPAEGGSW